MIKAAVCYKFKLNAIHNTISAALATTAVQGKAAKLRPLSRSRSCWDPHGLQMTLLIEKREVNKDCWIYTFLAVNTTAG